MTLSLYRGGPGGELVGRRRFLDVVDNSWLYVEFDEPLPAGTYYLEQSEPEGTIAWWSHTDDVYEGGSAYTNSNPSAGDRTVRISVVLQPPLRLAFVYAGDKVGVFVEPSGEGWRLVAHALISSHVDLRNPLLLSSYYNGFATRGDGGTASLTAVKAGYFGRTGVRDLCIVTTPDGTPYIRDNRLYLTATNAGLGTIPSAHQGTFSLNLDDYSDFKEVGKTFFRRGGLIVGDHAGKIVARGDNDLLIFASTWGATDKVPIVDVTLSQQAGLGLEGIGVVDGDRRIMEGAYDPSPILIDGRWLVPLVQGGIRLYSYDQDFGDRRLVGEASDGFYEGPRLQRIGGAWYIFTGGMRDYRIYDLQMRFLGFLNAEHPQAPNFPWVNPPHPMVTPIALPKRRTRYLMVTFSGNGYPNLGDIGELVVQDAPQQRMGYEF